MSNLSRIMRLAPRFSQIFNKSQLGMLQVVRPVTFRVENAKPIEKLDYDQKNMKINRPMSPHLTIYAPELQSFLSISHRFAGAAMTAYLVSFGLGTLVLPQDFSTYIAAIDAMNIPYPVLWTVRYLLILPFTFHAMNGIRHLIWDMGKLLYIKQVLASGYVIMGLAVALAISLSS